MLDAFSARFRALASLFVLAVFSLLAFPALAGALAPLAGAPLTASTLSALFSSLWPALLAGLIALVCNPTAWATAVAIVFLLAVRGHLYEQKVRAAIRAAFNIVEDMKATGTLPAGMTKPAAALEQLEALLDTQGITLNGQIVALAKLMWSSFHGEEKSKINTAALG